jgi:hypothetical protein
LAANSYWSKHVALRLQTLLFAIAVALPGSLTAQALRPIELGVDAGISFSLDDPKVTVISLPAQSFRIGFFITDRISIEPKVSLTSISGGGERLTLWSAELGVPIHLRVNPIGRGYYVRPFGGGAGASGGGESASGGYAGIGLGSKFGFQDRLATRIEGNYAISFEDDSHALGLLLGLSFFTR